MLKLQPGTKAFVLLAIGALVSASSALALDDAKPSKPLDLLAGSRRAASAQKPRPLAAPAVGDTSIKATAWAAEDAAPLITGAVPAPDNPPPAARAAKTGGVASPRPAPAAAVPADNEIAQFCSNVSDPAVDARLAWQLKELEKAENQLRERIAEVEAKRAEYEKWMALRDEFLKRAEASVVEIYSRMKPEAAATQIAGMADETAAAVLAKLSPRSSSAIFNEMDSARAAHLADLLGGMRRVDDGKSSR
ncbi:MotE family protein [Bradyrhizobium sp. WSM 1704]|uniref:MotE family protein n=1 Tax=Bradyrhizobium semiaridum TaxID=2821404 RepID=UPI001CE30200|nr:MotE family protein [Bradyrhizobium semiaridum]MCA6123787.1 MotE family protein [Bradyrhizobium semiaridum]